MRTTLLLFLGLVMTVELSAASSQPSVAKDAAREDTRPSAPSTQHQAPSTQTQAPSTKHQALSTHGEEVLPRNPFWPLGYEGTREKITAEMRVIPKPPEQVKAEREAELLEKKTREQMAQEAEAARVEAERRARVVTPEHWQAAYRTLRIGGRVKAGADDGRTASSVMINGKVYGDGDLISITHGANRFTWRVTGLTDGKSVRLERVHARHLGAKATGDQQKKNGERK